jgi:hypothetical protein
MVTIVTRGIVCDNLIFFYQFLNISELFISNGHDVTHGLKLCVSFFESFGEN